MVNTGNNQEKRLCPVCGILVIGRAGKRFCSEKCRSSHNAAKRAGLDEPLTRTMQTIRKNRSLLKNLFKESKTIVKREVLEGMGFDPKTFTTVHINRKNQKYYFTAEYGILPMVRNGTEVALIVYRQPYAASIEPWHDLQ